MVRIVGCRGLLMSQAMQRPTGARVRTTDITPVSAQWDKAIVRRGVAPPSHTNDCSLDEATRGADGSIWQAS